MSEDEINNELEHLWSETEIGYMIPGKNQAKEAREIFANSLRRFYRKGFEDARTITGRES